MNPDLHKPVKSFLTPVWIMAVIFCVRVFFSISSIKAMQDHQDRYGGPVNKLNVWIVWFFVAVTAAEAFVYWVTRQKNYSRKWVWTHLVLMIISMIIIPSLFMVFVRMATYSMKGASMIELLTTITTIRFYFFWVCFIAGNIFFILNTIKSLKPVTESVEDMIDAIGTQ